MVGVYDFDDSSELLLVQLPHLVFMDDQHS
jgi:hypothetical protein